MKYVTLFFLLAFYKPSVGQGHDLDYYIRTARQNSPTLREYQNQVLSLRIDSQLLRASLRPQVNVLSTNSYAPVVGGWGYDEIITNKANVSGIIQANRNFLTRGQLAAQLQAIALQRRALIDTLLLSQQDLLRTITDQYVTAYGDQLALDYNRELYEIMSREDSLLKKLTQASVYKQVDYLTFTVTLQQQELLYLQAQIQYNTDYLTLNYLAGIADTSIERIAKPGLADTIPVNFYRSVFYGRFVTDSLRLVNERNLIGYEYKPKVGAYTDAGYTSSLQVMPYKNFGFSAGLSLTVPIYDGHQRQLKEARIDIRERTRQLNRDFYIRQYEIQTQQLRQQLRAIDLLVERIGKQIEYTHTLVAANGRLLQTGDITMKDYVTAIGTYLNARNLLTQNTIGRLKILSQLSYWNIKP